ncbi:MAG TPA: RHS repeat-associated core domain-containing protein, partial [Tepidiformaceae bacterium]|nr:RHS repeat-associated core domain-containing protein [Tepidiformaceae bacterium]
DEETGLAYNRHRYFASETGAFLSPDPLGLLEASALYTYPSDVICAFDPLGLSTWTAVHNAYLEYVRPGARGRVMSPRWASGRQGTRVLDDFDRATRTGFEANTTPWQQMTPAQLARKLDQVAADLALVREGQLTRVIWFGTEALPDTGLGGRLRRALEAAGIDYYHIPPPNGCR